MRLIFLASKVQALVRQVGIEWRDDRTISTILEEKFCLQLSLVGPLLRKQALANIKDQRISIDASRPKYRNSPGRIVEIQSLNKLLRPHS